MRRDARWRRVANTNERSPLAIACECDVGLWSRGGARMFSDLLTSLCGEEGRRELDVLMDPTPVFLAHDSVFFTALDVDGALARRLVERRQPEVEFFVHRKLN